MQKQFFYGILIALTLAALSPSVTAAHGFGERYDLPVPFGLYVAGAGAAVTLSFAIIGLFVRGQLGMSYPRRDLLTWRVGRGLAHPVTLSMLKALSTGVFGIYLFAGLFGTENSNTNLVPTMTWVIFWVGVAYVSAFLGNVWALINPWKVIYTYFDSVVYRLTGNDLSRYEAYPESVGTWPAVVLFFIFAWVEVAYTSSGVPFNVVVLVLAYSVVTFVGMWWFGRDEWLRKGEVFTIVF